MKINWHKVKKAVRDESGQVFILVLLLLVVGSLILVPVLNFTGTGLSSGLVYEDKVSDYYSADAGVEDALWQITYDNLSDYTLFTVPYDVYGFDVAGVSYDYQTPLGVNGREVGVNIANMWIPRDIDPTGYDLQTMVESAKLVVAGTATGAHSYRITISYNRDLSDPALRLASVSIWLPPGFTYERDDGDTCSLESNPVGPNRPTLPPEIVEHAGGTVVTWYFPLEPLFDETFTGVERSGNNYKVDVTLTFHSTAQAGRKPDAIAWVTTTGVDDIPFAWDADVRIFRIHSVAAGGTEVEAYAIKTEQRKLAGTISGDYTAIGNSLMSDENHDSAHVRERVYSESSANASGIPQDAEVAAAYLYWSGWIQGTVESPSSTELLRDNIDHIDYDNCDDFSDVGWTAGSSAWELYNGTFRGHYVDGGEDARYMTLTSNLNLSAFSYPNVVLSFQYGESGYLESSDALQFQISANGGTSWNSVTVFNDDRGNEYSYMYDYSYTIPALYLTSNFKIRFYLDSFDGSGEYCYLDNIKISCPILYDDCSSFDDAPTWTDGSQWSINSGQFQGRGGGNSSSRTLTLNNNVNLGGYAPGSVTITWSQSTSSQVDTSDHFYYALYNGSWDTNREAFHGRYPSSPFTLEIPTNYLVSNFRIRFNFDYTSSNEYVYLDDITISASIFNDDCSSFNNWTLTNSAWSDESDVYTGSYAGADDSARYLPLTNSINLSAYTGQVVVVSWEQWCGGSLEASDGLFISFSNNGGIFWSDGDIGTNGYLTAADDVQAGGFSTAGKTFSLQIPAEYLTFNFKMRFYIAGFSDAGEFCYIGNIHIKAYPAAFRDGGSYAPPNPLSNWTSNGAWTSYYNSEIIGHAAGNGYLTSQIIDLSSLSGYMVVIEWNQRESGSLESSDGLRYQFSGDGGDTWSTLYDAFNDDSPSDKTDNNPSEEPSNPETNYYTPIAPEYATDSFRIRFYLDGFAEADEYCYLSNFIIYGSQGADTTVTMRIDGQQVYFDEYGVPRQGAGMLVADGDPWVIENNGSTGSGFGYSCVKDVTALVRAFCEPGLDDNRPGNGRYTVGGVEATPGGSTYQLAYAGWSLIIIYTSMATQGHQLYIYDKLTYADDNTNLDFDHDDAPGGTITGFIVPNKITGETYSAQITCFVGEGDEHIGGDYIKLNGTKLWDGINCYDNSEWNPNNVWNSLSVGMDCDGVDVDTFRIRWDSHLLEAGDTSAQLDMWTEEGNWNLIYIVISFRSEITPGGTITYLLR